MPAPRSTTELIELLRKSQLVERAKLDAYLVVNPGPFESPAELSKKLRADGLITQFHAEQLLKGKHRGFFLGKYKVLDRIGLGGMGQVFLAEHVTMRRRAAIKILSPERVENHFSRERFLREARAAGQLDHPNLVRAFDVDTDNNIIFLVMEYVDGVTFHDLITRFGPITPARAGYFLWQAAQGLAYMHARGLVHRDIKPSNLLLERTGVVKILDLGLVRSEHETDELTRGEGVKILGTADYLSPEQAIDCSKVDVRADIYSLGATAYFLVTGQPPFGGDKIAQKLIAHQVKPLRPVHEIRPDVPLALSEVISKMLAKKVGERYQTPEDLAAALEVWAVNPPPPPTEQEIPSLGGELGSPSSVNIGSTSQLRSANGSSDNLSPSASSGSAIRYISDSNLLLGSRILPKSALKTPTPATHAASKADVKRFQAPALPASATHRHTARPDSAPVPAPPIDIPDEYRRGAANPDLPEPVSSRAWTRRTVLMALAFGLTLLLTAWNVAVLTGAVPRPTSTKPEPPSQDDAGPRRLSANTP